MANTDTATRIGSFDRFDRDVEREPDHGSPAVRQRELTQTPRSTQRTRNSIAIRAVESFSDPKVTVSIREIPEAIAASLRAVLATHGLSLSDDVIREIGNNAAQAVTFLDALEDA